MSAFIRYTPVSLGGGSGGGGSTLTMGTYDGQTHAAAGATITTSQLFLQSATATFPGLVVVGNITDVGTDGIVITGGTGSIIGSGVAIAQHVADSTHNGYLSSTDWSTFNNKQATLTLTNLTDVGTDGIVITNGTGAVIGASPVTIAQHVADSTHNGYLSSTDWSTFNGKQAAGNYITALTGDGTAAGPGSAALTLATVNSNVGTFGDSSHLSVFTVNGKGLITAASSVAAVSAPAASIFSAWDANKNLSANSHINGFRTQATAAGTTTLVVGDAYSQFFTGGTTQTVKMPVTSTLVAGMQYVITNLSSGVVTVQSSGANTIQAMAANTQLVLIVQVTGGTGTADWSWSYYTVQNVLQAGTVTSVACTVPAFLSIAGSPITSSGTLALSLSGTALPVANGGTAKTSVTTAPAATSWAGWDANSNLSAANHIEGYTTQATAAGTTTLVVGSNFLQYFTGTSTQICQMPVASTLVTGMAWQISNLSTGVVTVNSSGSNQIIALPANTSALVTCITASGTSAASWSAQYTQIVAGTPNAPTIQTFVSGSGTYTTPTNPAPLYITVEMVGGGGGGGGSGTTSGTAAGNGVDSTFSVHSGAAILTASGGLKGARATDGGAGGSPATVGAGATKIIAVPGGAGGGSTTIGSAVTGASTYGVGGQGGSSPFGGAGFGGAAASTGAGGAAGTNTGGGGGGAYGNASVNSANSGSGGGSGAYIKALVTSPSASYDYVVGGGGAGQLAGLSGAAGGAGGSGYIVITEYYPAYNTGAGNYTVDTFSGDNSTTAFTLTAAPATVNNCDVYISGVYQNKAGYTISGTTLTFGTAPPTGTSNIQVNTGLAVAINTPADGTITAAKFPAFTANTFVAGPASGASATPTYRTIVPADLPSVYAFYTGNAGTALTANTTNIDWATKVQDSNNAWNGTTFTAPYDGYYLFSGSAFTTAGVTATLSWYVGGTIKQALGGGTSARVFPISFGFFLSAGGTLTIRSDTNSTLSNSSTLHWISIASQW